MWHEPEASMFIPPRGCSSLQWGRHVQAPANCSGCGRPGGGFPHHPAHCTFGRPGRKRNGRKRDHRAIGTRHAPEPDPQSDCYVSPPGPQPDGVASARPDMLTAARAATHVVWQPRHRLGLPCRRMRLSRLVPITRSTPRDRSRSGQRRDSRKARLRCGVYGATDYAHASRAGVGNC